MQGGCQPRSIPYTSTDAGEEHAVPGREENRQDDREIKEKRKKQKGKSMKGTMGEGLPQHGYAARPLSPLQGERIF